MATNDLARLIREIVPERTVLFFGAGATRSSGALLAIELCRHLEKTLVEGEHLSDDLAELASLLLLRMPRRRLIDAVVERLRGLQPDSALVALARYRWPSIYTTNYDLLVESAYSRGGMPLTVVRSHFDWDASHTPGVTTLYKLHGCITQDTSFGHKTGMTISMEDYQQSERYRDLLLDRFKIDLAGGQVCIIGHSLRDSDIQRILNNAIRLQREAEAPGRIHLIVYEYDRDRAEIWRRRGVYSVTQGDINSFVHELAAGSAPLVPSAGDRASVTELPHRLKACTLEVTASTGTSNARRLFFGAPASYGDITAGYTFQREAERELRDVTDLATVILGAGGTGKTTLARRLLLDHAHSNQWVAFEHRQEFTLVPDLWLGYEATLRQAGAKAVLLLDNCAPLQRQVNQLVHDLPVDGALHLVITAETSAWKVRQKDPRLFSSAKTSRLSTLSGREIADLQHLVIGSDALRALAEPAFLRLPPEEQRRTLQARCSADMFVCLKTLFGSDTLDDILLREYAAIDSPFREIYRITAGLEAAGALPHRQMILRVSGLSASLVASAVDVLEDLVEEQEESATLGVYICHTRYEVIAGILSRFKYSEPPDLKQLLEVAIETANPSYFVEARMLREMCNADRGIRALPDPDDRIALYRLIYQILPGERVASHRLVAELLDQERLGDAEAELHAAISDVRLDPPLQRYRSSPECVATLVFMRPFDDGWRWRAGP